MVGGGQFGSLSERSADSTGLVSPRPALKPGQKVRILSGPLVDMIGELALVGEDDRVEILLEFLGARRLRFFTWHKDYYGREASV